MTAEAEQQKAALPPVDHKSASQAKLRARIFQACQQATACTPVEVIGALETVKMELMVRALAAGAAPPPGAPPPQIVTPSFNGGVK